MVIEYIKRNIPALAPNLVMTLFEMCQLFPLEESKIVKEKKIFGCSYCYNLAKSVVD